MARIRQYYGDGGAPISVATDPSDVAAAWLSQRSRLRAWFSRLPDDAWQAPTRCSAWDVEALAQHLVSGAQFLGYTLHQARRGEPTSLLQDFDPQVTPGAAARMFAGLPTDELLAQLEAMDANVERQLDGLATTGWDAPAEVPLGRVPAYLSVNHFLFDSWVHEHDLMLPAQQQPVLDVREATVVAAYVLALAGAARYAGEEPLPSASVHVHLTDVDVQLAAEATDGWSRVAVAGGTAANVTGTAADVVDAATGRPQSAALTADPVAIDYFAPLARVLV